MAIDVAPDGKPDPNVEMISSRDVTSPLAESFRSALASLWFAGQTGKRPRVFVLTSPNAREGKTTLTSNLGIALANTNRRVLLIDGDIRKPRLHSVFNVSNAWGLGNLLEDDCPVEDYNFEDIVSPTAVAGLYVLPAGAGEVNVSSLRYHERLTDLLARFRLEFHAVLLDTPPMLEFSDARVLGRLSDGVIMVVRASETSRDDAAAVYRRFQEDGTPVLGSILNDWNPKKSNSGYGYRTSGTYEGK
jgi:receptor protein-tyrosine kinase